MDGCDCWSPSGAQQEPTERHSPLSGADSLTRDADIAWREDRVRFWAAIARGLKTDVAGIEAGVSSPVAYRWFRHAGGVNPCLPPTVTGRYLSFSEREDIAIWRAQKVGVREIARRLKRSPSTISRELRRNASTREYPPRLQGLDGAVACRTSGSSDPRWPSWSRTPELRDYVQERLSGQVKSPKGRAVGPRGSEVEGTEQAPPGRSALGQGLEPRADLQAAPGRFPR